jgi:hypothetical protein
MKFKFNIQKSLLVGGLLAAAYADADCWVQTTSFLCVTSGSTVDSFSWLDNHGGTQDFTATSDWWESATANFVYSVTSGGHTGYTPTSNATYCDGPAKFTDFSSHSVSIPDWQIGSLDRNARSTPEIHLNATTTGSGC